MAAVVTRGGRLQGVPSTELWLVLTKGDRVNERWSQAANCERFDCSLLRLIRIGVTPLAQLGYFFRRFFRSLFGGGGWTHLPNAGTEIKPMRTVIKQRPTLCLLDFHTTCRFSGNNLHKNNSNKFISIRLRTGLGFLFSCRLIRSHRDSHILVPRARRFLVTRSVTN